MRAVLQSPVRVLVIAPDTQTAEDRDNHLTDMKTLLGHPEPEFFQVVKSRRELLGLTASFPPTWSMSWEPDRCKKAESH